MKQFTPSRATAFTNDPSVAFFGCLGIIITIIAFVIVSVLLRAVLVYYYFEWFISPMTEWHLFGFLHALGLAAAISYIINGFQLEEVKKAIKDNKSENKTPTDALIQTLNTVFGQLFTYVVAFVIGYVVQYFMR